MIGIIVANVPEGLLPQMTVALTLTARRMLRLGVLVSNLEIIETLGAVDVICSDKTGTLTCNRMTVAHLMYNLRLHTTEITTDLPDDKFALYDTKDQAFELLQRVATLNTEAVFLEGPSAQPIVLNRKTRGDASESAIIKFVQPFRDIEEYRSKCKTLVKIPFNSANKWMLTCTEAEGDNQAERDAKPLHLMLKGAPERVWNMCSNVFQDGKLLPMTSELRSQVENLNLQLGKRGERVLAFATQARPLLPFPHQPPRYVCDRPLELILGLRDCRICRVASTRRATSSIRTPTTAKATFRSRVLRLWVSSP
jgi:sodium/potassium-transporting ATPase subunit alpha